jgi:DNA-binding beta-propeller fold protein YncE
VPTFTESTLYDPNAMPADVSDLTLNTWVAVNQDSSLTYTIQADWIKPDDKNYSHAEIYMMDDSSFIYEASATNYLPDNGNGEFNQPMGVCSDGTYIYVADNLNHRIVKLNAITMAWVANIGSEGTGDGQFKWPSDVCTDGTHIWVADTGNHRIQKLTVAGAFVDKLGAVGAGNDQFQNPAGICHDQTDTLCVADTYNHRLVEVDEDLDGFAGAGTWNTFGAQGAANGQFERPMGIDVNPTLNMYFVADTGNNRIQAITTALVYSSKIGTSGTGNDNFQQPMDVACDTDGDYIWVADTQNFRVVTREDDLTYYTEVG